ncbi:hypothetical protein COU79_05260 [Candidatus Peregrinibacteria bacterium CG10_big_fil_rev_8_21_14_0_10_54_7]|nr:MAG: hypothetical protein COU79_05260 [Candidatus Peregrinibacteria bacterium CG10_big_fil_rev_8_21_14_0_10_54_7]
MAQKHFEQQGTFHAISNAKNGMPWCTQPDVPELLVDNLVMTRNLYGAALYAFCVLPDHVHIVLSPGPKGLSRFIHSFKRNSSWHIHQLHPAAGVHELQLRNNEYRRSSITPAGAEKYFSGWQNGFYDERIRDEQQRSNAIAYVQHNAYRHGLIDDPCGWPWSSLAFPDVLDPLEVWFD